MELYARASTRYRYGTEVVVRWFAWKRSRTVAEPGPDPANTMGFARANASRPFPLWAVIQYETNGGWSNYHALQAELNKRFARGIQFQASYVYLRNLANNGGNAPSGFPSERG